MIKQFLESLEDPKRPLLGPNYWIMEKIGILLPNNKLYKIAYMMLHELVTLFVITQYVELYFIRSDLDQVLTNLKISMLSIVCVVKTNTCALWQNSWKEVMDYVTEADKYERDNRDATKGKIIDDYTRYCRRITYFYWVLVFVTFITVTTTPLMIYLSSPTFREEFHNGTKPFPHIFSSWMPVDKNRFPGCWITVLSHIFMSMYGGLIMAAYDTSMIVMIVFFGGKLELLRIRGMEMFGKVGVDISDEEAEKMICQLHRIHGLLSKYSRKFNSLLSPVMFLYVLNCSFMFCASAFQLTATTNAAQKLLMAEYLIFGIAQLFMFCWHSNQVLLKSQNVSLGPYESQWWTVNVRHQKSVLVLAGQFRIVHIFTAGPFTNLTLSTFITILKGAYSYYTLLRK